MKTMDFSRDNNQPLPLQDARHRGSCTVWRRVLAILMFAAPLLAGASPAELIPILETAVRLRSEILRTPEAPPTKIPSGAAMKKGAQGKRIGQLNTRLAELGYPTADAGEAFDERTDAAVRTYQERAGLRVDGIVDEATRFNLNLSQRDKLQLLDAQFDEMERFYASHADQRMIIVNIPAYSLRAIDHGRRVLDSRVIVGKPGRQTPLMKTRLTGIVLNPGWSPPPTILAKDIFRTGELDLRTVRRLGLKLVDARGQSVPFDSISTHEDYSAGSYRFYQPSSDANALGRLKFDLDNPLNIYLHDTNHRDYFNRSTRALSSGCVRVERFRELAAWILGKEATEIDRELQNRRTRRLDVDTLPVFTVYWQAEWTGDRMVYHPDVYGLSFQQRAALKSF